MRERITIQNGNIEIPTILLGEPNGKVIIAVHEDMSNKEDTVIRLLAKNSLRKNNYQILISKHSGIKIFIFRFPVIIRVSK